jgi:hypothetical protein
MFGELPKLFDRNFAMGFFLPFAIFTTFCLWILEIFGVTPAVLPALQKDILLGTTLFGLGSWVGGIVLLVSNRDLYRILEGYGKYNPLKLFSWIEKRRFCRVQKKIEELDDQYRECLENKNEFPVKLRTKRNALMKELVERFPDKDHLLLPTPFGNTFRAFEIYPRVMYGMEAIDGWGRLLAIIPKKYRELIEDAKTQVDFWINLGFLSILLLVEYGGLSIYTKSLPVVWLPTLVLVAVVVAPWRSRRVATEYGDLVKSAFDLYRFSLLDALGIEHPSNRQEEKEIWQKISQAIIYRLPDSLPDLKRPKRSPDGKKISK